MQKTLSALAVGMVLSGCATFEEKNPCENIEEIRAQERRCETLRGQIELYKSRPVTRTTLEEQYQKECVDFRFYRDTFDEAQPCLNRDAEDAAARKEANKAAKNKEEPVEG